MMSGWNSKIDFVKNTNKFVKKFNKFCKNPAQNIARQRMSIYNEFIKKSHVKEIYYGF